jgi:hypothetical protein
MRLESFIWKIVRYDWNSFGFYSINYIVVCSVDLSCLPERVIFINSFRGLLGLGEAGNWPGAVKKWKWFSVKQRAIAQGIFNAGASLGSVIARSYCLLYGAYVWK